MHKVIVRMKEYVRKSSLRRNANVCQKSKRKKIKMRCVSIYRESARVTHLTKRVDRPFFLSSAKENWLRSDSLPKCKHFFSIANLSESFFYAFNSQYTIHLIPLRAYRTEYFNLFRLDQESELARLRAIKTITCFFSACRTASNLSQHYFDSSFTWKSVHAGWSNELISNVATDRARVCECVLCRVGNRQLAATAVDTNDYVF